MRLSYRLGELIEAELEPTWFDQFRGWFAAAVDDPAIVEANAVQLATADAEGRPSVRTVLAKTVTEAGLVFYTGYDSAKGHDLAARPYASAVFAWLPQQRQVRLTGAIQPVSRAETEAYFAQRPRGSQLGAWASPQSEVVSGRDELDRSVAVVSARFEADAVIPPPPHWGGYLLEPDEVEFWQGRDNRMHDRIRFRRSGVDWVVERLAP